MATGRARAISGVDRVTKAIPERRDKLLWFEKQAKAG